MPYKEKAKDRGWHREYMRQKRHVTPIEIVTPQIDAERPTLVTPIPKPAKKKMGRAIWLR